MQVYQLLGKSKLKWIQSINFNIYEKIVLVLTPVCYFQTVYESFCVPRNPIINYLTEFSGITPEMLKGVSTRLEDVQKSLRELLPSDVILVGQSLNGDLHALKVSVINIKCTKVGFVYSHWVNNWRFLLGINPSSCSDGRHTILHLTKFTWRQPGQEIVKHGGVSSPLQFGSGGVLAM